ncbi:MAG: GUN4 domain-containing protein [Arthrospira sp. SH-MAG29]|nr:GUN4 domain-containing protein [Arthrospira sp. SH-MAG29]MBS0017827.1 GUN4 domain-containing protein [Arthrospira sp. SH-MAG29]
MRQCLNPDCLQPNLDTSQFCQKCGNKLLLRERYAPQSILGQGGFGRTFLAIDEDKPSKPYCVIKQFLPQAQGTDSTEKASQLFAQEAQRLEQLGKHPQIPELMAYFTTDNRQYLVQEFVEGETLKSELDQNGFFSQTQVRGLLIGLLKILKFVHGQQVIHRDIKPENIIRRCSDHKLFLVDFGAAKVVQQQQRTATGTIIGSAEYCAPEQSMGKAVFMSDLYSLGVTCLHLLTGVSPFDLYDPMNGKWVWRDSLNGNVVSDELGNILDKLANPIPKHRYQSVEEVMNVVSPPLPPKPVGEGGELKSAVGMDYRRLRDLLAGGKWKEADEETRRVILVVGKREDKGWLDSTTTDKFPCEDLCTIDQLWLKYSHGRFGFSVQQRIYKSLGGTKECNSTIWESFGERVGWKKSQNWLGWKDIIFDITAPEGHLPLGVVGSWSIGNVGGGWVGHLLSRVDGCQLSVPQVINTVRPVFPPNNSCLQKTLMGHSNSVYSVAFSPDNQTLASGSSDKTIKLWDVTTGKLRETLTGHSDWVSSVAFSRDGQTLCSGSGDNTIKLWDVTTGKLRETLTGHPDWVRSVAFSRDGQTLASGSFDKTIKLWDVRTGKVRHTLTGHSDRVYSVAFSRDGQTLASGSSDKTIKLWEVKTGKLRHTLTGHSDWVRSVAFSRDGKTLASASFDKTVKRWDVRTGQLRHTLTGHSGWVWSVAFSRDGQTLASGSLDNTIKLWDVRTGKLRHTLTGHSDPVNSVAFSQDGQTLASGSGDNTIKLWWSL